MEESARPDQWLALVAADVPLRVRGSGTWQSHQRLLRHLYIDKEMSTKDIQAHMLRTYNFQASIQQYNRKFTEWDYRKNLKSDQWIEIASLMKQLRLDVDHAQVWYRDKILPRQQLRKQLSRYDRPTIYPPSVPEHMRNILISPASLLKDEFLVRAVLPPEMESYCPERLPWFSFVAGIEQAVRTVGSDLNGPGIDQDTHLDQSLANRLLIDDKLFLDSLTGSSTVQSVRQIARRTVYLDLEPMCTEPVPGHLSTAVGRMSEGTLTDIVATHMSYAAYVLANNQMLLYQDWSQSGFSIAVCSVWQVIHWICDIPSIGDLILRRLKTSKDPTTRSTADRLMAIAVENHDLILLQQMRRVVPDLNHVVHSVSGKVTLLQLSIRRHGRDPISLVGYMLEMGADPNLCGVHGRNSSSLKPHCCDLLPLHLAIKAHRTTTASRLLEYGAILHASFNLTDVLQVNPSLKWLLSHLCIVEGLNALNPKFLDFRTGSGTYAYPLQAACATGQVEMVELLLVHGAYPNGPDAASVVRSLGAEGIDRLKHHLARSRGDTSLLSPLEIAVRRNSTEIVKLLLQYGAIVNSCLWEDVYGIWEASNDKNGLYDSTSIRTEFDKNHYRYDGGNIGSELYTAVTALQVACTDSDNSLVDILLQTGADPNPVLGTPPLTIAALHGNNDSIRKLLCYGARPHVAVTRASRSYYSPLAAAASIGSITTIEILLQAGSDINDHLYDPILPTALQAACHHGKYGAAWYLLEHGAFMDSADGPHIPSRFQVWRNIIQHDQGEFVHLLVQAGIDINGGNGPDISGLKSTPLSLALEAEHARRVRCLSHKPEQRRESLCCDKPPSTRMIRLLLSLGASPSHGESWAYAVKYGDLIDLLYEYGFDWTTTRLDAFQVRRGTESAISEGDYSAATVILNHVYKQLDICHEQESCFCPLLKDCLQGAMGVSWWFRYALRCAFGKRLRPKQLREQKDGPFSKLLQTFLIAGADTNSRLCSECPAPLILAKLTGNLFAPELLARHGAKKDVDFHDGFLRRLLHRTILKGPIESVKAVIDCGASVNAVLDYTDVGHGGRCGCTDCEGGLCFKLKTHENAHSTSSSACLHHELHVSCDNIAGHLFAPGQSPLQTALWLFDLDTAKWLVIQGADVNSRVSQYVDDSFSTSLAHENCHKAASERTALQEVCARGDIEMVRLLINHGADVNAPAGPFRGITALQAAAIGGYLKITQILLSMGADVAAPASEREGRTAIDGAAERGRLDTVSLLLDFYQGEEPISDVCKRASEYARKEGHMVLVDFLATYERPSSD